MLFIFYHLTLQNKTILISPLNWGLGHATRIVPIINKLKDKNKIIIASDLLPYQFLKTEFPNLQIIKFPSFEIKYPKNNSFMPIKMLFSSPKIFLGIAKEHFLLKKLIKKHNIDIVISDNRFGLWNKKIYTIFITHQIMIKMTKRLEFMEYFVFLINKYFISKYNELWIPDLQKNNNLSGDLSHKYTAHKHTKFIGILSRFEKFNQKNFANSKKRHDIVAIISGPEPQKTIFFELIYEKLKNTNRKTLIIAGKPGTSFIENNNNIEIVNHLETNEMFTALKNSELIISRAGYSTIMDLHVINKKAILVPTPGQTEQEYLANYLKNNRLFTFIKQDKILNFKF